MPTKAQLESEVERLKRIIEHLQGPPYEDCGVDIKAETVVVSGRDLEGSDHWHTDCGGFGFEWKCPSCGDVLRWAPSLYWPMNCKCRTWAFEIKAIGERRDSWKRRDVEG